MYVCMLARRGKHLVIAKEGKTVNIVTSRALPVPLSGWPRAVRPPPIWSWAWGEALCSCVAWSVSLPGIRFRFHWSCLFPSPLSCFLPLTPFPEVTLRIYAFFYTANAYEVSESHPVLVSALFLKSQEKRDVIYRHAVTDTDESFFFFFFNVDHF